MSAPAPTAPTPEPTSEPAPEPAPGTDPALLYGHDPTERIVALHPVDGVRGAERMRVYRRLEDDTVTASDEPFHPFFFLADDALLAGFGRGRYKIRRLDGEGFFKHLVVFPTRNAYWDAIRHIERASGTEKDRPDAVYTPGGPEQQYLTQTGRTLFKGMELHDLHRFQLDIEVAAEGTFPVATNPDHAVIIIAMSDNRGWSRLVHTRAQSEKEALEEMVRLIREKDPDTIEGHNIHAFDFAYLIERCRMHGVPFAIGRDGSEPRTFPSSMRFAERSLEFDAVEVAGRHVVDTLFQVMAFDVFKRDLPNYTLKGAARYFGFAPEGREDVEGRAIGRVWNEDPERILRYALDDVVETERLARHLSGSTFYLAQMVPMPYGQAARTGPAAKIEALFVRGYLHARHSLPKSEWGSQVMGGYTDVFVTGVVGPIVYADVESLYPSIMLNYSVRPSGDALGIFPRLLRTLTELRLETKAEMKRAESADARGELDARQTAYKNIINSFYGNLGFGLALFNDFAEADRVASIGQDLLRVIIRHIRQAGGTVVEVDTDGVLFVPPPDVVGEQAERAFVDGLTEIMPEGIRVGFDGRYQRMLSYKKKNYALLAYDGHLSFKGSSLVSRSVERFGRRFVREATELLLEEDLAGLHRLYLQYRRAIQSHDWTDGVESFQRTETLKNTLEQYERDVADGKRTRSAAYELARRRAAADGRPVRVGERVAYYLAQAGRGARGFEAARLAELWDPANPDESTAYYLDRLDQVAAKFETFFATPHDFRLVFSEEDLFGFDPSGLKLKVEERPPEELEDDVPF